MGWPNAWRSFAYRTAWSSAPWARPTAIAAMAIRPPSSTCLVSWKPRLRSPRRFAFGTRTPSRTSSAVSEAWRPSFL